MEKQIIDLDDFLVRVQDDTDLLIELIGVFIGDCSVKMQAMKTLAEQKDLTQLENMAHSLKGASANISANNMREIFLAIEKMANSGDISAIDESFKNLEVEFSDLKVCFEEIKKKLKG